MPEQMSQQVSQQMSQQRRAAPAGASAAPGTARVRLDAELVRRGLARSRDEAVELVRAGAVSVAGHVTVKPATRITVSTRLDTQRTSPEYVSRGAYKLAGALADFAPLGLSVRGRRCLDVGASTGGFTDVLLRGGAAAVAAVDVGTGQLAPALVADPRVRVHDAVNARDLVVGVVGVADVIVADVSFISLRLLLPALTRCLAAGGDLVAMVKPQFELGRGGLDSRGVVRDRDRRHDAVLKVAVSAAEHGLGTRAAAASHLPGPAGNLEYFLWLRRDAPPPDPPALRTALEGTSIESEPAIGDGRQ